MKQKYLLLFACAVLLAVRAISQSDFTFSGKITDARSGEILPGASIYFTDDKIGATTNAQGLFIFKKIRTGHHVVEISHTGYTPIVEHIELTGNMEKNYSLSPVIIENQGVIVTGVSGATSMRKTPVPVTQVRKLKLLQTASTNIIDALSQIPGISQLSTGPAISKPVIRGLSYNRVTVINDGVRLEGQQWGDEHGIELDELSVARAEIIKGPASLIYGSDAMAGVINFLTHIPVADGDFKGNILTNYQSNNGLLAVNGNISGNRRGFNWNIYGTHKTAGNYKNRYDGRVLNSGFNEKNFGGYIGINRGWGFSHLLFSRFDQRIGLVEGERDDATGNFILFGGTPLQRIATDYDLKRRTLYVPMQRVQHNRLALDNSFLLKKSRIKINLAFQNNLRQEFGEPEEPDEKELFFDLKTFNYNFHWQLPQLNEWHTTIGINGMQQTNSNKGEEVLIPEYSLFDAGAFVFVQRSFKKATVSGGLRLDSRSVNAKSYKEGTEEKFTAFTRRFSNISGSAGVSFEPTDRITLKLNLARGFRAPTLAELASNGAHEGTNRYEYGNKQLKSETSLQLDAGLELNTGHFSIGFAGFYNRINDFIFYRKLESVFGGDSLVNVDGEDIPSFIFNQQSAVLTGAEITSDIHPHPLDWLHFENSFSFVAGKFDNTLDGSENLPLIPAAKWKSELKTEFKKAGKYFENLYAKIEMENTFSQEKAFTGFDTETATAGYTIWNVGAGTDVVNRRKKNIFSIYLSLINMTDVAYQNHLSRLKYAAENKVTGRMGVFNAGRNFSIKLNVPFVFTEKKH
jgi:iron complex outermembrane receptor protein